MSDNRNDSPEIDEDELLRDIQASLGEEADDRPSFEALLKVTAQTVPPVMAEFSDSQSPIEGIEQGARDLRLATKMLEQTSEVLGEAENGLGDAYRSLKRAETQVDLASQALSEALAARLTGGDLNAAFGSSSDALASLQQAVDDLKFSHAWCQSAYASYAQSAMSEAELRDAFRKVGLTT